MVTCEICKKEFRVIKQSHLRKHNTNRDDYKASYPDAKLFSDETKKISSEISKKLWKDDAWAKNCSDSMKGKTQEYLENQSLRFKKLHAEGRFKHIYSKERNKKISKKKTLWWREHPEEKERVAKLWIHVRDTVGEKVWRAELRRRNLINTKKNKSSFQSNFEEFLNSKNINFISEYELENRFFDIYLIDKNILIELDGDFWHKDSILECKYNFQIKNYKNDKYKDDIAKRNNIKLIRIKETEFKNYIGMHG